MARSIRFMRLALIQLALVALAYPRAAAERPQTQLMWSASPLTPASLSTPDMWLDVPDTVVGVDLPNEAVLLISYDASVSRVNELNAVTVTTESELSFRVVLDGSPYRESATTVSYNEPLVTTVSGYLVIEASAGKHEVKLQWRRRGEQIKQWLILSGVLDGFAGGRTLIVSAEHRFIWNTQPLTPAALTSVDTWSQVSDMALNFRLLQNATLRVFYQLPVRPLLVQSVQGSCCNC